MKNEEPQFISLAEAAKITNYSQDYISLLCRKGKLRAEKLGRNWVTTKDWVYSYVDNTAGKGESVVPVKIKEKKFVKSEKQKQTSGESKDKKPFFSYSILECALFCFASMIWSINVFAFTNYMHQGDFDFNNDYSENNFVRFNAVANSDAGSKNNLIDDSLCASGDDYVCGGCGVEASLENLDVFEKETDKAIILLKRNAVREKFGDDVESEIYKTFAVLNSAEDPEKKFLYMMEE